MTGCIFTNMKVTDMLNLFSPAGFTIQQTTAASIVEWKTMRTDLKLLSA